ncbi:gp53-like domain-containing protein [Megamonas funiformis]|uniref:gp53-like domain-containing protein n=1 Tax=Megamonas funiformis TaxID=437897 RepID=UPI00265F2D93|nr:hypothetical protein [Megamonas funiformis]
MASTNFLVFDEGKQNMMSDGDYSANTQRARGVTPGIAYPNLHNKLYYQVSVMAKAIADFMVAQGANASDEDVEQLTADISTAFTNFVDNKTKDVYLPLSGGTMKGNINANGYNITATKFIGNLQGKADSAANADLATKANQDSQGQVINTTYVKGVTASNATLTVTKGNGTTSTVTINNVENSKKATQDSAGNVIENTYVKNTGSNNMSGFFGLDTACGLGITSSYMGFFDSTNTTYVLRHNTGDNYVTAITPPTNDNSTKLATTAFVKSLFTASKQDNGWWKDGNTGLIYQWRKKQTDGNSNGFYSNFPITFPNALLLVIPTDCVENQAEGNLSYVAWGPDSSDTSKVYLKVNSGNNIYSYLAIGY